MDQPTFVATLLPSKGPFTDKVFAAALGISTETFRDWVLDYSLKGVKRIGSQVIVVDADAFYSSMPDFTESPRASPRPKKPR